MLSDIADQSYSFFHVVPWIAKIVIMWSNSMDPFEPSPMRCIFARTVAHERVHT